MSRLLNLNITVTWSSFAHMCDSGAGEELLGQSVEVDASGNRKLPAIGVSERLVVRALRSDAMHRHTRHSVGDIL